MFRKLLVISLFLVSTAGMAQHIQATDLLHYLQLPKEKFEQAMFRQGFVCFQNTEELRYWSCLFAYQPIPYLVSPDQATAVIHYTHNTRSASITYQIRSSQQYHQLKTELAKLGYRMASTATELAKLGYRAEQTTSELCIFSRGQTVITCEKTDPYNSLSGNTQGHTFTLFQRRY